MKRSHLDYRWAIESRKDDGTYFGWSWMDKLFISPTFGGSRQVFRIIAADKQDRGQRERERAVQRICLFKTREAAREALKHVRKLSFTKARIVKVRVRLERI